MKHNKIKTTSASNSKKTVSARRFTKKQRRLMIIIAGALLLVVAAGYTVFIQPLLEKEGVVYEEAEVYQGTLKVEIVESGSLEYTIQNIAYDIDVNVADDEEDEEDDEDEEELTQKYLVIEEIYTAAGTLVQAGEPLLKFSDSSVESVRKLLQSALVNAEADYNEAESAYKLSVLEAESNYEIQKINGKYAGTIYADESSLLSGNITSMELEIQNCQEKVTSLEEAVTEAQESYNEAKENYDAVYASYMQDFSPEWGSSFVVAQTNYLNAKSSLERAESSLTQAKQNLESNAEQIEELQQQIVLAKAKAVINRLEVEQTYAENRLSAENAGFSLDVTLESLAEDLEEAEEEKVALEEKLAAFEELVGEQGIVYATADGLITSATYSDGDTLERMGNLFSYATADTMHITVDVTQEDIVTLSVGDQVSIDFSAYQDAYEGYIESINTTATSAGTPTVSYQVVIQVVGTLDKLFDGMSANVSFVTDERENAVYIQRKGLIEENGKTYVYVKNGLMGKTLTQVETGIRNENYVEITQGLSAEDTIYVPAQKQK